MSRLLPVVTVSWFVCIGLSSTESAQAEPPQARVADLGWMSGTWAGPMGEQQLEEQWTRPSAGTMAGLIRITASGATGVIELILIEETDASLVLRVRQWLPGFVALAEEPLTMELVEIGERRVSFAATGPGALKKLSYARPADDAFHIDAESGAGAALAIRLTRVSLQP